MNPFLAAFQHRAHGTPVHRVRGILAAVIVLGSAGCSVLRHEAQTTESLFRSVAGSPQSQSATNAVVELQNVVMREADLYVGAVAEATDAFAAVGLKPLDLIEVTERYSANETEALERLKLKGISTFEHLTEAELTEGFAALDRAVEAGTLRIPLSGRSDLLVLGRGED